MGLRESVLTRDETFAAYTGDNREITVYATECTCAQFQPVKVEAVWGDRMWICKQCQSTWTWNL